jgi:hypothetical protein
LSLYLIPVADALPALQEQEERWPDSDASPTVEEARDFIKTFLRFVAASDALLQYAIALSGCPSEN